MNPDQAAAVAAVEGYARVSTEIGSDPQKFTRSRMETAFKPYIGGSMVPVNVEYYAALRKKGYRERGEVIAQSIRASKVADTGSERGLEVQVTVCQDQSTLRIVDSKGKVVASEQEQIPAFLLRQYTVRKPKASNSWRAYGMETVKGKCP